MTKLPMKLQILPTDYLSSAMADVQSGKPVCGNDLLHAIEQSIGQPLTENARFLLGMATIAGVPTRGRPPNFGAARDFALEEAGWDNEILAIELKGLADIGFDVLLTGFEPAEVDLIIEGIGDESDQPENRVSWTEKLQGRARAVEQSSHRLVGQFSPCDQHTKALTLMPPRSPQRCGW
jgi:hypothetical protein